MKKHTPKDIGGGVTVEYTNPFSECGYLDYCYRIKGTACSNVWSDAWTPAQLRRAADDMERRLRKHHA